MADSSAEHAVLRRVVIHTDGACHPNPGGYGGWCAILTMPDRPGREKVLVGSEHPTTNNRMELRSVIEALCSLKEGPFAVEVVTDSQYVMNGFTKGWVSGWKRRGWRKADGDPVLNADLWDLLDGLVAKHRVSWRWIRGHSDHPVNERCDRLAVAERTKLAARRGPVDIFTPADSL